MLQCPNLFQRWLWKLWPHPHFDLSCLQVMYLGINPFKNPLFGVTFGNHSLLHIFVFTWSVVEDVFDFSF